MRSIRTLTPGLGLAGMISRVPEPELMVDADQARAYSEANFAEAHDAFVALVHDRCGALV
jgi:hypothetical protein